MSTLIILRGNSGSGKSTLARTLQQRLGSTTLLLSQDVVRRDMLRAKDGPETPALPLLLELLRYGAGHCETVILEGILRADWYRPLFSAAKELFGPNIFAYYYDLPIEETFRRHKAKGNVDFGEEDLRRWWQGKDLISFIPERLLQREVSLEEAVGRILDEITGANL